MVEAVVLRPFPFAEPDRVVDVHPTHYRTPVATSSNLEYATWQALSHTFQALAATAQQVSFTLTHGDIPEVVTGTRATSAVTNVLGVTPELGRGFSGADDQVGAPHVVILSHKLWVRDYNADRAVLGRQLRLDDNAYSIIGVLPASVDPVSNGTELWVPLQLSSTDLLDFKVRNLQLIGRLQPGVSLAQAAAAVDASEQRLAAQNPMWGAGYNGGVTLYSADMIGNLRTRLFILFGAVSFVFLIACVNVANLLLTRGTTRVREMAIRAALGATQSKLRQQLLTETTALWTVAGALGVGLAFALVKGLVAASPPGVPRIDQARIDAPVLLCALIASAVCSIAAGLLPAMRTARASLDTPLREGSRGVGQSRGRERSRAVLVTAEVAIAMALLTGAGLLIRTAWDIGHIDPGFDGGHVLTAQVVLPGARYADMGTATRTYRAIRDELDRTGGVQSAALAVVLPLTVGARAGIGAEGRPTTDGERLVALLRPVTPNYFATLECGLWVVATLRRPMTRLPRMSPSSTRHWPTASGPGRIQSASAWRGMDPSHQHFMQVIGVIADSRTVSLDQLPEPEFYIPIEQAPAVVWSGMQGSISLIVRTVPEPSTMEVAVRHAVDAIDPSLPVANVSTMTELARTSRATARFNTLLLSALAAIALILASVGIYGIVAYSASQRTPEIGLRVALGATPAKIAALVARIAIGPTLAGAAIGGVLSVLTSGVLRDQLYGVAPGDPATLIGIATLLVVVSLLAAGFPTWRAMRVSAIKALAE